jgi:four helix bundle protein
LGKIASFHLTCVRSNAVVSKEETYGLVSQLRRSAVSIPANIAEGCGKKGKAELAHFLNIALGSANESEYYVILSKDLNYISEEAHVKLVSSINEIKAMLIALTIKVRE